MLRAAPVIAILLATTPAWASVGENSILAGLSYDQVIRTGSVPVHGLGVRLAYRRAVADDWNVFAAASYAGLLGPRGRSDLGSVVAGAAYVIDVATWVPEVYAAVGWFGSVATRTWREDFGVLGGGGLEYRRWRAFGVGARVEYRWMVRNRDATPGALSVALYFAHYF